MSDYSLKKHALMLIDSLCWEGGSKTFEGIKNLYWLHNTLDCIIFAWLIEAECNGWIEVICKGDEPFIYRVTIKGREVVNEEYKKWRK